MPDSRMYPIGKGHPKSRAIKPSTHGEAPVWVEFGTLKQQRTRATIAQVNAGLVLLPACPGVKWRLVDVSLISIGGAVGAATTVDITATQSGSSVKLLAAAVAALTQNTLLRAGATNATILAGGVSFVANDANTAVSISKTGSTATTATHVDVLLTYVADAA